eukprot:scaffold1690_cov182-Amphora_coffeaeformis.AAC.1
MHGYHHHVVRARSRGRELSWCECGLLLSCLGSFVVFVTAFSMLVINLNRRSEIKDARLDDFKLLADDACVIKDIFRYDNSVQRTGTNMQRYDVCVEEWQYIVEVGNGKKQNFVTPTYAEYNYACAGTCENCTELQGRQTLWGRPFSNDTQVFVQCWASVVDDDLSNFYDCNESQETGGNHTCYKVVDPSIELERCMELSSRGLVRVYKLLGVGGFLLLVALFVKQKYVSSSPTPMAHTEKCEDSNATSTTAV